jgi:glycosyltransferase involved in cell wall biosynthesis
MNGRPRVLHVGKFYPPHRGGMESHLAALCTGLRDRADVEVIVASEDRRTHHDHVDGVSVTRVATLARVAGTSISPALAGAIRARPADIVHLHHPNPMAFAAWLASGHAGRLVVTYHSDIVQQRILARGFDPLMNRVLGRADAIIATSPAYAASSPVLRRFASRCTVVPLGITPQATPAAADVARVRGRFGERIILAVGRLVYYKGLDHLVRAMKDVDGTLLVIGDGPLRRSLGELAASCGVPDRVKFLGAVEDVTVYYHAADVFVLPSCARSEAFGIVQVEAMAAGTPVVNTALDTGVPWVSRDGETGMTVPPADAPALAHALNRVLADPALRNRLGTAARRRAVAEFSEDSMVDRTMELYGRVLRGEAVEPAPARRGQEA